MSKGIKTKVMRMGGQQKFMLDVKCIWMVDKYPQYFVISNIHHILKRHLNNPNYSLYM